MDNTGNVLKATESHTVNFTSIKKKKNEATLSILIWEALQDVVFSEKSKTVNNMVSLWKRWVGAG